ncbi:MAG: hypothetical protein CM1200mP5_2650 [Candidatus Pelagibacterales bacterium]|nr:MAG: hypothetical protein CM1200mP5_2650 [Pelagibacterales bacterium]
MYSCCKKDFSKTLSLGKAFGKRSWSGTEAQSDDELNEYIRSKAETAYHPCGT